MRSTSSASGYVLERAHAEERRARRGRRPVHDLPVGARVGEGEPRLAVAPSLPLLPDLLVLRAHPARVGVPAVAVEQRPGDRDGARRVGDVHDRRGVGGFDLDRGVDAGRRRAADQQRRRHPLGLHERGDVDHLVERRRDQARQTDQVGVPLAGGLEDPCRRHHDAEVDHLVVVAAEHDADDVLADVVDVALHGRHHDRAGPPSRALALLLEVRDQVRDGLLHDPSALDDLGQEHAPGPEPVADDVHARHQRALDDVERPLRREPRLLGVLDDPGVDALDQRVRQSLVDREVPPAEVVDGAGDRGAARVSRRDLQQAVGRVGPPVEDHVLHPLQQVRVDVVVLRQGTGVDDRHVEAGADGVVQEHGVDRLAHAVVAAEREGHVGHAAADPRLRELRLEAARRLEERDRVAGVLLDARGDREDVGVEDDVVGREPGLLGQQPVRPGQDRDPAVDRIGLALLVERHHHRGGAVAVAQPRLAQELGLALLERDRVHDRAALELLQPGLDHRPLGAVDHDGHGRDVRLRAQPAQVAGHRGDAVEHRLVHVDVEDHGAVGDLVARDRHRLVLGLGRGAVRRALAVDAEHQAGELARAGDVGPLADVDERAAGHRDHERLEAREPGRVGARRDDPRRDAGDRRRRWPRCARACSRSTTRRG